MRRPVVAPIPASFRAAALATCLVFLSSGAALAAPAAPAGNIVGTWRGYAIREHARLELSLRFFREKDALRATISSPDLLLLEAPLETVEQVGRNVRFLTPDEHPLRFHAVLDGDSLHGEAFVPAVPGVAPADRDQPSVRIRLARAAPRPAPPYATREVHIAHGALVLAGTLHLPPGAARHPGIVLLPGSSSKHRQDLAFFADHFARNGLAVLVFDKRGTGGSPGDYGAATYEQLASDAAAAVEFLRKQPGVDAARVGVWGLSQGALLAPMVAARVPLRFLVAISAPGIPTGESAAYQDSIRLVAAGFDAADTRRMTTIQRRMSAWLKDGREQAELSALLAEASGTPWRRASSLPARLPSGAALEGWYWRGRALDPDPFWRAVKTPVLLIYGEKDELLEMRANMKAADRALHRGRNPDVTIRTFPFANHVLRTLPAATRGPWDWPRAAPGYLELVTNWILAHAH
jgi:pimeloyl-ACP methyl ester carboxylesterase